MISNIVEHCCGITDERMEISVPKEEKAENSGKKVLILNGGISDSAADSTTEEVFGNPMKEPSVDTILEGKQSGSELLLGDDSGPKGVMTHPQNDQTHLQENQIRDSPGGQPCTHDDRRRVLEGEEGESSDEEEEDDILFDIKNQQFTNFDQPGGSKVISCGDSDVANTDTSDIEAVTTEDCDPPRKQLEIGMELETMECRRASSQDPVESDTLKEANDNQHSGLNGLREFDGEVGKKELVAKIELLEKEKESLIAQLTTEKEKETSMQEVVKEVQVKCFQQQEKIEDLEVEQKESAEKARLAVKELQERIDKARQQHEDAVLARDTVITKAAVLQEKCGELVDQVTEKEKRLKEVSKENDKLEILTKKQRSEVLKLQGNADRADARCSKLSQENSKHKEEVSSINIRVKWAQNKLKVETEAHKNVKAQLELMTKKLKEAKEEGDMIRADLKKMIKQYQESEEMRSNSLDIKLKKTKEELVEHEQEIADQHELHVLTVKELELTKTSHKIAQEEIQQHKQKITEMTSRAAELIAEIQELKGTITKLKLENKRLSVDISALDQKSQCFEKERMKFAQLREVFTQLQKSYQHLEKELEKGKERETELLAFSAKLSSSNAELKAERTDWEAKIADLCSVKDALMEEVSKTRNDKTRLQEELQQINEDNQLQLSDLLDKLDGKTKAVEELSMALEDERELVKATKRKNANVVRDLKRQLQNSNRQIKHLEEEICTEKELPATIPIMRAHSHTSLDRVLENSAPKSTHGAVTVINATTSITTASTANATPTSSELIDKHMMIGAAATIPLSDDERGNASPSPEYKFYSMDHEKILLVEKMCHLKKEQARQEEKFGFYEDHISQLTEDIKAKSRIIQSFIMREHAGALAPPSFDENKVLLARKGGVMGSVFSGKSRISDITLDLSLEMNRKMQSVLEDTLLKNITLKENIDTLGKEIQRISAQLQTYEHVDR